MSSNITFLPADILTGTEIKALVEMVNKVYTEAEKGLFAVHPLMRTSDREIKELVEKKELMLLRADNKIIGCINVVAEGSNLKLGMLTVSPELKGKGYGKLMMGNIEKLAREKGCRALELELLTPVTWVQSHKKFLEDWYKRLGFAAVREAKFPYEDILACECKFTIYEKALW